MDMPRSRWITVLKSVDLLGYKQGKGALARCFTNEDSKPFEFCCLGVARNEISQDQWRKSIIADLADFDANSYEEYDDSVDYEIVSETLGLTDKQVKYLMAMNDGEQMIFQNPGPGYRITRYTENDTVIRHNNIQRDFKFIGRFLEIMWMGKVA